MSLLVLLFTFCFSVEAKVALPKIFSDNLVLQRGSKISIWGGANQGERIEVSFNHQKSSAVADSSGKWSLKLKAEKAGEPFELWKTVTKNAKYQVVDFKK